MFGFIFIAAFSIWFLYALHRNLKRVRASRTEKSIWFSVFGIFVAILLFAQYKTVTETHILQVECHALFQTSKTASDTLHNLLQNKACWEILRK